MTENSSENRRAWRPFLRKVQLRNYRSIGQCHVELNPLTVLIGRNGAGKSNFLDALHFVADSLRSSLDHALRDRGGVQEVRRLSTGHPRNFLIGLEFSLPDWITARYSFEIAAQKGGAFGIKQERLRLYAKNGAVVDDFERREGKLVKASLGTMPPVAEDRLYLANAAGLPEFREAYDALTAMGFYNLNPEAMKELQSPDAGELLRLDQLQPDETDLSRQEQMDLFDGSPETTGLRRRSPSFDKLCRELESRLTPSSPPPARTPP